MSTHRGVLRTVERLSDFLFTIYPIFQLILSFLPLPTWSSGTFEKSTETDKIH